MQKVLEMLFKVVAQVVNDQSPLDNSVNLAIDSQNLEILKLVFENGGKPVNFSKNSTEKPLQLEFYNTLSIATKTRDLEIIRLSLSRGAKPNNNKDRNYSHTDRDNTIHEAIKTENQEIIDLILLAGADPESLLEPHPRKAEMKKRLEFLTKQAVAISTTATILAPARPKSFEQISNKINNNEIASPQPESAISNLPKELIKEIASYSEPKGDYKKITDDEAMKAANFGYERKQPNKSITETTVENLKNAVFGRNGDQNSNSGR